MSGSTDQTLTRELLRVQCHPFVEGIEPSYNYVPSLGAGIAFCVLFGLSLSVHTIQFIWTRTWWCSLFSIGALGEPTCQQQRNR